MRRTLIVAAMVSISLLVLPVPAIAGGFCMGHMDEKFSDAAGTEVRMSKNCFSPTVIRVDPGDTVTFVNMDPEVHAVGGAVGSFGDAHAEIPKGESVSYAFEREGVFPYACVFHPGMTGAVVVGDGLGETTTAMGAAAVEQEPPAQRPGKQPVSETSGGEPTSAAPWALALGISVVLLAASVAALTRRSRPHRAVPAP